jgi:hypothetical protein
LLYVLIGSGGALFALFALFLQLPFGDWLIAAAVACSCVGLHRWITSRQDAYAADLARRINASGLLERLALDAAPTTRAVDYVPPLLRSLFPRLAQGPGDLKQELSMIGANLEWYLRPPGTLLKLSWLALPMFTLVLAAAIGAGAWVWSKLPYGHVPVLSTVLPLYILVAGELLFLGLQFVSNHREAVSRGVLAEELLKRLDLGVENKVSDPALRAELGPPQLSAKAAACDVADAG